MSRRLYRRCRPRHPYRQADVLMVVGGGIFALFVSRDAYRVHWNLEGPR